MAVTHSDVSSVTSVNVAADPFTGTQTGVSLLFQFSSCSPRATRRNPAVEQVIRKKTASKERKNCKSGGSKACWDWRCK